MITIKMDDPCYCSVCGGRPGLAPEIGKPWRRWHEIKTASVPCRPVGAINIAPPIPEAKERASVALSGTLKEQEERIRSRTDISNGMKAMQINNLRRKYESLFAAKK